MRESITVAYLEDDLEQGRVVAKWLAAQKIQCCVYETAQAMRSALNALSFDVIMLDVEIDGVVMGFSMIEYIRQLESFNAPVLMVSSKSYWDEALSSGADDFLEKPLSSKKLLLHIDWLLRPVAELSAIESFEPYQIDTAEQCITVEGVPVELSEREYELAATLFRNYGKIVPYQALISNASIQANASAKRMVQGELIKLKRKMGLQNSDGWRLESVYQHGCRLNCPS